MKTTEYTRIPVLLRDDDERELALKVRHAVENRLGNSVSWAVIVRLALKALADVEGITDVKQ
jgi:hypothetical protein